ncbi:MAG: hypothetical protein AUI14_06610 [Actinobacteria bacterium 13_2_20CM_2_71_6]|nr:MAG: hypothetical protein AUI14_06610 [Actinobacteria bacterium 13_2_20CM_2_71_6]
MGTRLCIAIAAVGAAFLLGACSQGQPGSIAASGGSMSPSPTSSPSPSESSPAPLPSGLTLPPSQSDKPAQEITLTGQVEPGVEHGCLILQDGGKTYQLMNGDPAIVKAYARVRVTGHIAIGVMSYCMQGQPFRVTSAQAL